MTEILSQDEIDALLSAISSGEIEPEAGLAHAEAAPVSVGAPSGGGASQLAYEKQKRVKMYDFKRPDKFSKDQIRTLQMIHEAFARLTTTALSARLRTLVHVHVGSVDQLTYEEFIKSIPNPTVLSIVEMLPLKGNAVLEVDPGITFAIIDRLFGGKGNLSNLNRELTEIENSVMERIILRILNDLKEAWANVVDLKPRLGAMESNPQFVQIVPPNDMVVLITLETRVGEVEGMTNLCIPYITIEPIISKLSAQFWYSAIRKGMTEDSINALKGRMSRVKVPIIAELGTTEITVREMLSLSKGDVIKLEQKSDEDSTVYVANRPKFNCRPGIFGKTMSVQVTKILEDSFSDELILQQMKGSES